MKYSVTSFIAMMAVCEHMRGSVQSTLRHHKGEAKRTSAKLDVGTFALTEGV